MTWHEEFDVVVAGTGGAGKTRVLESPPLPPGVAHPLHLRAAFAVGDRLLIQDKRVLLRAGENLAVTFDGVEAISVPLK